MVNILLDGYNLDSDWLYDELKKYLKPEYKVAVVAFSFRDSRVKNNSDWQLLYGKEQGNFYGGIIGSLCSYGIKEENITFLNYFEDTKETAKNKIQNADIIYFLGGLPDRMMDRLKKFGLIDVLTQHNKVVIGYSAGAVIQFEEYFLTPDDDYPTFNYYKGIPYLKDFYLVVHYENTKEQNESIDKVLKERRKTVYVIYKGKGAVVIKNDNVKTIGNVKVIL